MTDFLKCELCTEATDLKTRIAYCPRTGNARLNDEFIHDKNSGHLTDARPNQTSRLFVAWIEYFRRRRWDLDRRRGIRGAAIPRLTFQARLWRRKRMEGRFMCKRALCEWNARNEFRFLDT